MRVSIHLKDAQAQTYSAMVAWGCLPRKEARYAGGVGGA
jgi:hypothetical protein